MSDIPAEEKDVIAQLKKFYDAETLEQVVLRQARQIERLQEALRRFEPPPVWVGRPREG